MTEYGNRIVGYIFETRYRVRRFMVISSSYDSAKLKAIKFNTQYLRFPPLWEENMDLRKTNPLKIKSYPQDFITQRFGLVG